MCTPQTGVHDLALPAHTDGVIDTLQPRQKGPVGARALTREIDETRDVAAEVSKALPRVQRENQERRTALSTAGRTLTETEISASMLRLARLDVDSARSRLGTLGNRIEQHESALALLHQQIQQRASTGRRVRSNTTARGRSKRSSGSWMSCAR